MLIQITLPSGSKVQVDVKGTGMNIYVYGLPRDAGKTFGLCGNYDGDWTNDLQDHRTQRIFALPQSGHPIEFTNVYKLVIYCLNGVKFILLRHFDFI